MAVQRQGETVSDLDSLMPGEVHSFVEVLETSLMTRRGALIYNLYFHKRKRQLIWNGVRPLLRVPEPL